MQEEEGVKRQGCTVHKWSTPSHFKKDHRVSITIFFVGWIITTKMKQDKLN